MPYLPNLHTEDEIRLWIRDILLPGHEVVVAEVDDRPAGFAALDGDELAHLYVHPGLQGPGIGDALVARIQELRPAGFRLWVFQRNTSARRFNERLVELTDGAGTTSANRTLSTGTARRAALVLRGAHDRGREAGLEAEKSCCGCLPSRRSIRDRLAKPRDRSVVLLAALAAA